MNEIYLKIIFKVVFAAKVDIDHSLKKKLIIFDDAKRKARKSNKIKLIEKINQYKIKRIQLININYIMLCIIIIKINFFT